MGRKGVSKRKPKKDRSSPSDTSGGSSNTRSGEHAAVASLVKDKSAPLNRGGTDPSAGTNKKHRNGS